MASNVLAELKQHLNSRHIYPTPQWLLNFSTSIRPTTPLPALKQTALFRLLATDITTTVSRSATGVFPPDVLNAEVPTHPLPGPVLCQVLDIEDIGHSNWSQVEAIEAKERGETTKGREVIRTVPGEDDLPSQEQSQSKGPFKLLLQDAKGTQIYAFDLKGVDGLNTNMNIGLKLMLRGCDVRRGTIMLDPASVRILGGKIETLDKVWKESRKERLIAAAKAGQEADG
ncbi:hypothetical protein EJ04DRAFT_514817 [Polyplosphaeria fusca]|uniref:RecQ-mediated genome instability protein 1 n=1 Tax=Polyplosphaeria fusca TaxID=682080 RepID=A0A9P4QU79_9PLEO|nr:hypothetical protein EJ04DRAFT_514817 [Polyplosphaeria fusca]